MTHADVAAAVHPAAAKLLCRNPHVDLARFDFHDRAAVDELDWSGVEDRRAALGAARAGQRALRLHPNPDVAGALVRHGHDSAHRIASYPEPAFVQLAAPQLPGGADTARQVHRQARSVKGRVSHLFANVKDAVASRYYNATMFASVDDRLASYVRAVPGYTELFGSLDYLICEHCQSLLSPAAYFVDLMRVTDQYITTPDAATIPAGFSLKARRPDIFALPLTCENTDTVIPYLQVVNGILERRIAVDLGTADPYPALALAPYPFNLPFQLPLTEIRTYLDALGTTYAALLAATIAPANPKGVTADQAALEQLRISVEEAALDTTPEASAAGLSKSYGFDVTAHLPYAGAGNVTVAKDALAVTGDGAAKFSTQTHEGDLITVGAQSRTVTKISSDTQLEVEAVWSESAGPSAYTIGPYDGLNRVATFLYRTRLTRDQFDALLVQELSPTESAAGVGNAFFINATGENLPPLSSSLDRADPNGPFEAIANLSLPRLDRLSRFIRLSAKTGWTYAQVDYMMKALGQSEITPALLASLGTVFALCTGWQTTPDVAGALIADLKTYGKVSDTNPQDDFDLIFNSKALLQGKDPYAPGSTTPFDPKQPLSWEIADRSGRNAVIRNRLIAALAAGDTDLTTIATWVRRRQGIAEGKPLVLDLATLSGLYRVAQLPKLLQLDVVSFLRLLELVWYPGKGYLFPPPGALAWTLPDLLRIQTAAQQTALSTLSTAQIDYVVSGERSADADPGYTDAQIPQLVARLSTLAVPARVTPETVVFGEIDGDAAASIAGRLQLLGFLSPIGIFSDVPFDRDTVAGMIQISPVSFVGPDIDVAASQACFQPLIDKGYIAVIAAGLASVTSAFTAASDLSFLFDGSPDAEQQREYVRAILLTSQAYVTPDADIAQTVGTLQQALKTQGQIAAQGLSDLLGSAPDVVAALVPYANRAAAWSSYLIALLTPAGAPGAIPAQLAPWIEYLARGVMLAANLALTTAQIAFVVTEPQHFGIAGTALTLDDVFAIAAFKRQTARFGESNGGLIAYFTMRDDAACAVNTKIAALSALTGWPQAQICAALDYLRPDGSGLAYADTVQGVANLELVFGAADRINGDVQTLVGLATACGLGVAATGAWETWTNLAGTLLSLVNGRYPGAQFDTVFATITGALDTAKRDALMPYAVWEMNARIPTITDANSLYEYLLIDVQMSSCATTSLIAQAIATVQLYMQRCRMSLEAGVSIDPALFPDVWWEWLSTYRVWEADRKIYLYPENYVTPTLRSTATNAFKDFSQALLQNELNDASVTDAYTGYMNEVSLLANLQHCASYGVRVTGSQAVDGGPSAAETYFIFARTNTAPFTYYYRTLEDGALWSDWQKIDVKIGAPYVTPAYAFERLFLFWVEQDSSQSSTIANAASTDLTSVRGAIRYSFLNVSGAWVAPQTLSDPAVINFTVNLRPDDYVNTYTPVLIPLLQPPNLYWHQVEVLNVPPPGKAAGTPFTTEMLLVNYGFGLQFRAGIPPFNPPDPPASLTNRDEIQLDWKACNALRNVDALVKTAPAQLTGYAQYQRMISLDPRLVKDSFYDVQLDVIAGLEPAPYGPALNRTSSTMGVGSMGVDANSSLLRTNFYDDDTAANPTGSTTAGPFDVPLLGTVSAANSSVFTVKNQTGSFVFNNGDEAFLVVSQEAGLRRVSDVLTVRASSPPLPAGQYYLRCNPYTATPAQLGSFPFTFVRLSTNCLSPLSDRLFIGGVDRLLTVDAQRTQELPFSRYTPAATVVIPPVSDQLDFHGSFGIYFQEIFFFGPFLVADRLTADQKFSDAKRWFEFVFNPTAPPDYPDQPTSERVWRYLPFRTMGEDDLVTILTDPAQIAYFNNHPFDPDAVASLRHTAYAKAIVMRYIDNLINWGDSLFARDTSESINEATMLYVLAKDLLGPAPQIVGTVPPPPPKTFDDIAAAYPDGIPEFLIQLENVNAALLGDAEGPPVRDVPFNDVNSYFCIPENAEFVAYWARIDDRLFKIRHCMNLQGVVRPLALFAPPIDPMQLIGAAASGAGINVSDTVAATIPFYRFDTMIERAKAFVGAVVQLGGSLLAALDRKDGDALEMLRVTQEHALLTMMTYVKEQQIAELGQVKTGLVESQASAQMRATFYDTLLTVGLSPNELLNIEATILAGIFSTTAGAMKTIAAVALLAPNVGSPFAMTYGGQQIGNSLDAASAGFEVLAGIEGLVATLSGTVAGYQRRAQDWQLQANIASSDVKQIASQIAANDTSTAIAQRDLQIHLRTIAQNEETEEFLKRKFTSEQLFGWMADRLSTVYYQTYTLAFDLARAAQSAFQYETNSNQSFITFGYWDSRRKGLLAGETLMLSLAQLEKAYIDVNARPLEIERTISLLQLDPKALLDLKNGGECLFSLDELLFDQDFPGQFNRKIKSISISIPAVVGPYQNVKATLTQLSNQVVLKPNVSTVKYLTGDLGPTAPMPPPTDLRSNWRTSQAIAISRGMDDSGMFELNFRDERYLPFEGTGAVSTWRLSMPPAANRINYAAIADVVLNVRYTAFDGGSTFRRDVVTQVPRMKLYAGGQYYDLAQQYSDAWYAFMQDHPPITPAAAQTLTFALPPSIVPPHVSNAKLVGVYFRLNTAPGVDASSSKSYAAFTIAGKAGDPNATTLDLVIGKDNTATPVITTPIAMKDVIAANRTIAVTLNDTPPSVKDVKGYLDPTKLFSFQLILSYTGALDWA